MIAQKRYTPSRPKKKMDLSCQGFDLEKIRKLKGKVLLPPVQLYLCVYYNGRKGYCKEKKFKAKSDEIALKRCQITLNTASVVPWAARAVVSVWVSRVGKRSGWRELGTLRPKAHPPRSQNRKRYRYPLKFQNK